MTDTANTPTGLVATNPDLISTITTLCEKGAGIVPNVTVENVARAAELLARVREAAKALDAAHKEAVAELKRQLAPFDSQKKSNAVLLESYDLALSEAILKLYADTEIGKRLEGVLGSTISIAERNDLVLDESTIRIESLPNEDGTRRYTSVLFPFDEKFLHAPAELVNKKALFDAAKRELEITGKLPGYVKRKTTRYITTRALEIVG